MSQTLRIGFLGAARTVTGSRHHITWGESSWLYDCGLYQGHRDEAEAVNRTFQFDPASLDGVVISHAHLDHTGNLPTLMAQGFDGPIDITAPSADLSRVMLPDSAHLMEKDVDHVNRHRNGKPARRALYNLADVTATLERFSTYRYDAAFSPFPGVTATYHDAGHILGSAMTTFEFHRNGRSFRLLMGGDLGRDSRKILRDPDVPKGPDALVLESTYGDRLHADEASTQATLVETVKRTVERGGRVVVPAFAVGRTQAVVLFLGRLMERGRIPRVPVFVDSPMSREATRIMANYPDLYDDETRAILRRGEHPFYFAGVRYVADVEESKSLNSVREAIIVSASGMCESGRILHHLKHSIDHPQDCLLLVGFQAQGTLGRRLLDGERRARILGVEYDVRCRVRFVPGLSAHADYRELLGFTGHLSRTCRQTFVVHGESPSAESFADKLRAHGFSRVEVPSQGDRFELV